ncbi:MAG: hypothetical protein ACHQ9S_15270 [Candidatus Binatia bacterium]
MKPREFQALAERLASHGTKAAEFRTAISRSYYASYHTAFQLLEKMGFQLRTGSLAHQDVRDHLNNSSDLEIIKQAGALGDLYGKRKKADYDLGEPYAERQANAQSAVEIANLTIYNLVQHLKGPNAAAIEAAIQRWRSANGRS